MAPSLGAGATLNARSDAVITARTTTTALLAAWIVLLAHGGQASAETCGAAPVTARGEPSRYEWMARLKARANWRAKVRASTDLGPDWATWKLAKNTEERCMAGPEGTVCVFTGSPCRP